MPSESATGAVAGMTVSVSIVPIAADGQPGIRLRTWKNHAAEMRTSGRRDEVAVELPVSKWRRYRVDLSFSRPAREEIEVLHDLMLPKSTGETRSVLPSGASGQRWLVPKGARNASFIAESTSSEDLSMIELVLSAAGTTSPVMADAPFGAFLNGKLPRRAPGSTYTAVPAFPNLTFLDPSAMIARPDRDQFFVTERGGRIFLIDNNETTTSKRLALDISPNVAMMFDSGLYNLALHPNFTSNGYVYLFYTWKPTGTSNEPLGNEGFHGKYQRLARFTFNFSTNTFNPASELVMVQYRALGGTHRGGGIAFGGDGFLYLTIGEEGVVGSYNSITSEFFSGVIRVDVDMRGGNVSHPPRRRLGLDAGAPDEVSGIGYYIPADNPFVDASGSVFEEFYCVGTRNPYSMTYDAVGGRMWIGEVGDGVEELNIVRAGANFQYPAAEGKNAGDVIPDTVQLGFESPADVEFPRAEAACVIAGFVYRGAKFPELRGKLIAGDYIISSIWAIDYDAATRASTKKTISSLPGGMIRFGEDRRNGEIFCFSGATNGGYVAKIYKLQFNQQVAEAPLLISQTGAFADVATLEAAPGMRSYNVNMPLWSDGAAKQRWVGIPTDGFRNDLWEKIVFSESGNYDFPNGSVFIKNFSLGNRRVSTRFLVRGDDGLWYGLDYRWRPDLSDADLVPAEGLHEVIYAGGKAYDWQYPGQQQCFSCHTSQAGFVLGFRTSQLNASSNSGGGENFLIELSNRGYFDRIIGYEDMGAFPQAAQGWDDYGASLEHRVKSYLDSNCSHCHRPNGPAGRAVWDARLGTPVSNMGLLWKTPIDPLGNGASKLVMPGVPQGSILLKRLNEVHTAFAMPPLGKDRIDDEAVRNVAEWIKSMDPTKVDFFTRQPVLSVSGIDFNGNFLYALNVGGPPVKVGSLQFTADDVPGVSIVAPNVIPSLGPLPDLPGSPVDAAFFKILNSLRYANGSDPLQVTLGGVVPDRRYKLQMFFGELCCNRDLSLRINGSDVGEISTLRIQNGMLSPTIAGMVTYEFTSSTETVAIEVSGAVAPILSGLTLEDLGERHFALDTDGDDLTDGWELLYAPDLTVLGAGDYDNDGQSDVSEFVGGTNPTDSSSVFSATLSLHSPGEGLLQWPTELGTRYQVLESNDLTTWSPMGGSYPAVETFLGTGGTFSLIIPTNNETEKFFRVQAQIGQ